MNSYFVAHRLTAKYDVYILLYKSKIQLLTAASNCIVSFPKAFTKCCISGNQEISIEYVLGIQTLKKYWYWVYNFIEVLSIEQSILFSAGCYEYPISIYVVCISFKASIQYQLQMAAAQLI